MNLFSAIEQETQRHRGLQTRHWERFAVRGFIHHVGEIPNRHKASSALSLRLCVSCDGGI